MSNSDTYISLTYDTSKNEFNTEPSLTYNYSAINCYFNSFLPKLGGINYSFASNTPNIFLKRNSKSNDINQYYSSNFTIVKRIHAFQNVSVSDLEMIIEHIPDPKNTDQNNLYLCFGFLELPKFDVSLNSKGFNTMFDHINTDNINAATLSQANRDNYKLQSRSISFNGALANYNTKDEYILPDAIYYLDSSANTFIVYKKPIPIFSTDYRALVAALKPVKTSDIFSSTDCQIVKDGVVLSIKFQPNEDAKLNEGFISLREGMISLREGVDTLSGNKTLYGNKYVYCRPSDNSNGDKIVTTAINGYANVTNKNEGILLNEVIMIFIIMIVFLVMALFSPLWFLESNKFLKYNVTFLWIFRIAAIVLIFGGGLLTIVVSRVSTKVPDWLLLVGVIMIICFVLFYIVVYSFQKNRIHTQLTEIIENTLEDVDKNNIKYFRNYIFGETI